ncbi:hypothetical protein M9H77_22743 [Catharanthus roseus]|uniref:Uncharacterized protein n=1 Tax=Catharanthus roseus TaxID=4058 RepID=A0ACC0ASU1_CATRO|nr:hypothetical protein M9H77_22743 [Catharanthus roseus]
MVEDNGEDEYVRKPIDTFCNRKEVVEEGVVSKGPDNINLEHEHSAINTLLKRDTSFMNDEQAKMIKPFEISKDTVSWVVNNFDCERWSLNLHGKIVSIDEKDVENVLGIKSGVMDIIEALVKGNCDSALARKVGLEIEHGLIALPKIRERLMAIDSYEKEFIMKYVLFIVGKFLSPLTKSSVRRSMLSLLSSIKQIRELNWSKFVLDSIVIGLKKRNRENKASILYMEHFYTIGERMLSEISRNQTRVLNWDENRVLSRVTALQSIGHFRGEDVPIVDVKKLGVDIHLEGVYKRIDLLDQNMKELRGGLEGVREEVTHIGKSVKASNRSVMEVVRKMKLRDIRDDIRGKEERSQKNSDVQCENKDRFCFGDSTKWNEEDDQLGGDVNDEIRVAGNKMAEWKIANEKEKESPNEEYVRSDNEYNDMEIDKDGLRKHVNGKEGQGERLREPRDNHIADIVSRIKCSLFRSLKPRGWVGVINYFACMLLSRARQVENGKDISNWYLPSWLQGNLLKRKIHIHIFNQFLTSEKYEGNVASCEKHKIVIFDSDWMLILIRAKGDMVNEVVHSISHQNDIAIRLLLDESNLARDLILKAFGYNISGPFDLAALFRAQANLSFYFVQ